MLTVRDAIPKARELATAEFATLRLRLLKIAARVVETTSRIHPAFAAARPEANPSAACPARCSCSVLDRRGVRPISSAPSLSALQVKYRSSGGEKPKEILCASSEEVCGRTNRTKKPRSHE